MYARFEVFRTFLCAFTNVFRDFVGLEIWLNVPLAIFVGSLACEYVVKYFKGINHQGGFLTW